MRWPTVSHRRVDRMIFEPLEIFLCLVPFMLIVSMIGARLLVQNIRIARKERNRGLKPCPYCHRMLNPEAYVCRFCSHELI